MDQEPYLERYPGFSTGSATVEQLAYRLPILYLQLEGDKEPIIEYVDHVLPLRPFHLPVQAQQSAGSYGSTCRRSRLPATVNRDLDQIALRLNQRRPRQTW